MLIDEKFEKEVPLSVDNNSAISTIPVSDPATLGNGMNRGGAAGLAAVEGLEAVMGTSNWSFWSIRPQL
jgi:hypothetical protein